MNQKSQCETGRIIGYFGKEHCDLLGDRLIDVSRYREERGVSRVATSYIKGVLNQEWLDAVVAGTEEAWPFPSHSDYWSCLPPKHEIG